METNNIIKQPATIEIVLLNNYMKYDTMKRLTLEAFKDSNATSVNVYIDLYQIFISLYRGCTIENYSVVTSTIINLCAHIRSYYSTRHRTDTKIFLVYSDNNSETNSMYYKDYNISYKKRVMCNPQMYEVIHNNLELLSILCPYLPNIFFKMGTFEPGVIIFDIIHKQKSLGNNDPSIIYSKSQYNYQIVPFIKDSAIFKVMKRGQDDSSKVINYSNVLAEFIKETRKVNYECYFDSTLLSLLMTLTNLPCRNIKSVLNINTAIDLLNTIVRFDSCLIKNGYNTDIEFLYDRLSTFRMLPISIDEFCNRFKALDLIYQHYLYLKSVECSDDSYLLELEDPDAVRSINDQYFRTNPLDLNRL